MSFLGMMLRTGLRRRWKSWLALSLLTVIVVGLVLAGAQTARRTATALPRFETSHGYDLFAYSVNAIPHAASLPGVTAVVALESTGGGAPNCSTCTGQINSNDFSLQEVDPSQLTQLVKLESGRLPDQSDPGQVLASENLASFGVHVGTVIHVPLVSSAQRAAVLNNQNVTPLGPTVALRVVGMEATEYEFPTNATPAYDLYTTTAFARKYNPNSVLFHEYAFRLRGGASNSLRFESALSSTGVGGSEDLSAIGSSVATSIDPQVVGWWILTALAALVGLFVLAQALARQDAIDSEDFPALRAVGAFQRQLVTFTIVRTVLLALVGVIGAVALATGLSALTPVGEARLVDPDPGFAFDPLLLVGGAAVALVVVVALGILPAIRTARPVLSGDELVVTPSRIVGAVSRAGAPPSALIGIRNALERGRGRSAVPVSSALIGCVLAVTTLCGAVVFSSSLSHLTATPTLYGQGFDAWFSPNGTGSQTQNERLLADLDERPGFTAILAGISGAVSIDGTLVDALAGQTIRGPYVMTTTTGVAPTAADQVLLGAKTMHQLGVHIGSTVTVDFPSSGGTANESRRFAVVGSTVLPPDFNPRGGLGTGAIFTIDGFVGHKCAAGPAGRACLVSELVSNGGGALLVRVAPGQKGEAALAAVSHAYPSQVNIPQPPTNLVNFGEAVNFPLILGLVVVLFGIATLLHLLLTSLNRRRRETGLLKSLGMVRRQIGYCVSWQTTTVAVIGIAIGVPLGVAGGRLIWSAFATNLGVSVDPVVTAALLAAVALGTLVVANVLALVPALIAARARPASLLRSE
jgi:ABC-type lipoprotein release transport system permease subunit